MFDAHVKTYEQNTGEVLQEARRANRFLNMLFKPKFGAWFNEMDPYGQKFNLIRVHNPNVIKDETKGIPAKSALAY